MANPLPMTLRVYRKLSSAMVPLAPALINRRLKLGKEDPERVGERRGVSADVRPVGPLVWIHGASVGEVLASAALIEKLRARIKIPISIDTSKSEVARAALDAGATMINDVTAGRGDGKMLPLAAERSAAVVLMHMQGEPRTMQKNPRYGDVVGEVADFFRQQYARALQCGVDLMRLAFDPGIGFGKTLEHNLSLLSNLEQLRVDDRPIVVGVSRKAFLGKLIGSDEMSDRVAPTVALTAILGARGADVFRVHDVKENVAALRTVGRLS